MTSYLRSLGIYAWDSIENLVLSSLVNESNLMLFGPRGTGKTYAAKKIAQAFEVASESPFEFAKLDGYASAEENFIGYPMPPGPAAMATAKKRGERLSMEFVYSPTTIAFAHLIFIDEATRIQREMQNLYLSLLDYRIVEGVALPVRYIWGAANPLEYESTVPMDQALADRWHLLVEPPSLKDMGSEYDRHTALESVAVKLHARHVDPNAAVQFTEFLAEARRIREAIVARSLKPFSRYVDAMVAQINKGLETQNEKMSYGNGIGVSPIDTRRGAIVLNNIVGLHAVYVAKKMRGRIKEAALEAFNASMVDRLSSETGGIEPSAILAAHKMFESILEEAQDPILTQIEREKNPISRVALAFSLGADSEDVSAYTSGALTELLASEGRESATIFAYALLSKLQSVDPDEARRLNRFVYDDLFPLVEEAHAAMALKSISFERVGIRSIEAAPLLGYLERLEKLKANPRGRLAILVSSLPVEESDADERANKASSGRLYAAEDLRLTTMLRVVHATCAALEPVGTKVKPEAKRKTTAKKFTSEKTA